MNNKVFLSRILKALYGLIDMTLTGFSFIIAILITNYFTPRNIVLNHEIYIIAGLMIIIWFTLLKTTFLARIPRTRAQIVVLADFFKLALIASLVILLLDYIITVDNLPAITFAIFIFINTIGLFLFRVLSLKILSVFRANGHNTRNIVVIANAGSEEFIRKVLKNKEWGYKILHLVTDSGIISSKYRDYFKIHPSSVNIKSLLNYDIIDELICYSDTCSDKRIFDIIEYCHKIGITIRIKGINSNRHNFKSRVSYFDKTPFLTIENNPINEFNHILKNSIEFIFSYIFLFILSPIILLFYLVTLVFIKNPVIVKERCVGLHGRKFFKFRFRTSDANYNKKFNNIGKTISLFLKSSKLDSIPQLFNVIRGEMSIIGPLSKSEFDVAKFDDWELKSLSVKPGVICPWDNDKENSNSIHSAQKNNIGYIENWSLKSDIGMFLKSILFIPFGR